MQARWAKILLSLCFFVSISVRAVAQDVSFQASVDRKKAGLDSTIILDLTATGVQNVSPVQLPEIDGFKSRYIGPSTSISIINGQQSSSVSQKYILYPQKTGVLTIPAFTVTIEGKPYATEPIEVEILESAPAESQDSAAVDIGRPVSLEDKAFLRLEIPREKIYAYERLPITIKLYANNISLTDIQFPVLSQGDLVLEDFAKPIQYQDILNGVSYDVVEFNIAAYASKAGTVTVDPAQLDCNVIYKRADRRSSMFGGLSDDFFNDFFGSYEKYPVTLKSGSRTVEVLPLPEGAPPGFGSAVGQFNFEASASPLEVNVGDPITIKMTISGNGDLKNVELPAYKDSENFKAYDPQIKQQGNAKTLEQVLIPKTEKVVHVPEASFVYFDPQKEAYATIRRGPFPLTVHPAQQGKANIIVEGAQDKAVAPETFGRDIIFIKEKPGAFYSLSVLLADVKFFAAFLFLYAAMIVAVLVVFRKNIRMKTDVGYAKRLRAPQKAKEGLRAAEHYLKAHKQKEFYDTAYKVLQKYFAEKFSIPEGMVTSYDIQGILLQRNISLSMVGKVKELFAVCEMVRYGATTSDGVAMQKSYQALKEIFDFFERI